MVIFPIGGFDMDTFIEHQGFYDYINHFISGAVLVIGVEILLFPFQFSLVGLLYEKINLLYTSENMNSFLWNACIVLFFGLICFLIGILMQELYSLIYEKGDSGRLLRESQSEDVDKCVIRDLMRKICNTISRLVFKTNKKTYIENIFNNSGPISNSLKRRIYKQYAQEIATSKELFSNDIIVFDSELSSYFFAYCTYYIQVHEQNKKTEKLRDIEGLSMSFSLVFLILTVASFIALILSKLFYVNGIVLECVSFFVYATLSIIFDYRAEKALKNRIRMTLAVYEAEKDRYPHSNT